MSYRIDICSLLRLTCYRTNRITLLLGVLPSFLSDEKRLVCVAKESIHILTRMMRLSRYYIVYVNCTRDHSVVGSALVNSALTKLYQSLSFFQAKTSQPSVEIDQEITSDMVSSFNFTKDASVTVQIVSCLSAICLGAR